MSRVLMKYSSLRSTVRRSVISTSHLLNGPTPLPTIHPASPLPSTTAFRYLFTRRRDMGCCELAPPLLNLGITIVPTKQAYLIERGGKYTKTLLTGHHFLYPFLDRIAHVQSFMIESVRITTDQPMVTKDNVEVFIKGMLLIKVVDPYLASYCAEKPTRGVLLELVRTAMRREVGKLTYRAAWERLHKNVLEALNAAEFRDRGLEGTDLIIALIVKPAKTAEASSNSKSMGLKHAIC